MVTLTHAFKVYIPSEIDGRSDVIQQEAYVILFERWFTDTFGGSTAQNVFGTWSSPTRGYVREYVTTVQAWTDSDGFESMLSTFLERVATMKRDLKQDCILVEYVLDGKVRAELR